MSSGTNRTKHSITFQPGRRLKKWRERRGLQRDLRRAGVKQVGIVPLRYLPGMGYSTWKNLGGSLKTSRKQRTSSPKLYPWVAVKVGAEGVNALALTAMVGALIVIGLWIHFTFQPVEVGTAFIQTRTAEAGKLHGTQTSAPTSNPANRAGFDYSYLEQLMTPDTPAPTRTPAPESSAEAVYMDCADCVRGLPTQGPTPTDFPWICHPEQSDDPCIKVYQALGVGLPEIAQLRSTAAVAMPTALPTTWRATFRTWTPTIDYTALKPEVQTQVANIIATVNAADATAEERPQRFSEDVPDAARTPGENKR